MCIVFHPQNIYLVYLVLIMYCTQGSVMKAGSQSDSLGSSKLGGDVKTPASLRTSSLPLGKLLTHCDAHFLICKRGLFW